MKNQFYIKENNVYCGNKSDDYFNTKIISKVIITTITKTGKNYTKVYMLDKYVKNNKLINWLDYCETEMSWNGFGEWNNTLVLNYIK